MSTGNKKTIASIISAHKAELAVFVVCFCLVGLLFSSMTSFTHKLATDQYERISEGFVELFVDNIEDIENQMDLLASLGRKVVAEDLDERALLLSSLLDDFDVFDGVYLLAPTNEKAWTFKEVQQGKNIDIRDYISVLKSQPLQNLEGLHIYIDDQYTGLEIESQNYRTSFSPVIFFRAVDDNNPQAGVVIAFTDLSDMLWKHGEKITSYIRSFSLKSLDDNKNILYVYQKVSEQSAVGEMEFQFPVAGQSWLLNINFLVFDNFSYLNQIPNFVLFAGAILTILCVLFVYTQKQKARVMNDMNLVLENKNKEMALEISERERLHEVLENSERQNQALIDSVSDVIFEINPDGAIQFLSLAWERLTGFDKEQSLQNNIFTLIHPEDKETQEDSFRDFVKGKKQPYRIFTRLRNSNGTFRSIEMALSMIRTDDKGEKHIVGTIIDMEQHKRAEQALQDAERKYRTIVEHAAGAIYQLTPEGIYLSANPAMAKILGYKNASEILRDIKNANEDLYVDRSERMSFVHKLLQTGSISNHETRMYRKDGSVIWINENVRAVKDEEGNILYHEGSFEDITIRKESEIAMIEAKIESDMSNRAKTEFLANMSHELRTPLNSIIGFSEIIKDEVFGKIEPKEYQEYAGDIYNSGKGLLEIINQILDISRIEERNRELNEAEIDVEKLIRSCLDLVAPRIMEKHQVVENNIITPPRLLAEERALKQIIVNLLSNAVNFTAEEGRISLSYEINDDGEFCISITDTGIGLSEDEIKKALSPFGQVQTDLSRSSSGTGLGLTLVDGLMKLHAGRLEIVSQKGIGTTATVIFPVGRVLLQNDDLPSEKSA